MPHSRQCLQDIWRMHQPMEVSTVQSRKTKWGVLIEREKVIKVVRHGLCVFLFQSSSPSANKFSRWQGIKFVSSETNGRPGLSFHFFSSFIWTITHFLLSPSLILFTQSAPVQIIIGLGIKKNTSGRNFPSYHFYHIWSNCPLDLGKSDNLAAKCLPIFYCLYQSSISIFYYLLPFSPLLPLFSPLIHLSIGFGGKVVN